MRDKQGTVACDAINVARARVDLRRSGDRYEHHADLVLTPGGADIRQPLLRYCRFLVLVALTLSFTGCDRNKSDEPAEDEESDRQPVRTEPQTVPTEYHELLFHAIFPPAAYHREGAVELESPAFLITEGDEADIEADALVDGDESTSVCFEAGRVFRWQNLGGSGAAASETVQAVWIRSADDRREGQAATRTSGFVRVSLDGRKVGESFPLIPSGNWTVTDFERPHSASTVEITFGGAEEICLSEIRLSGAEDPWLRYFSPVQPLSRCGDALYRPTDVSPVAWEKYACVNQYQRGRNSAHCLSRSQYSDVSGTGCPGSEMCCPPSIMPARSLRSFAAASYCGDPAHRPTNVDINASEWSEYRCMSRPVAGHDWPSCLERERYSAIMNTGCPGQEECCRALPGFTDEEMMGGLGGREHLFENFRRHMTHRDYPGHVIEFEMERQLSEADGSNKYVDEVFDGQERTMSCFEPGATLSWGNGSGTMTLGYDHIAAISFLPVQGTSQAPEYATPEVDVEIWGSGLPSAKHELFRTGGWQTVRYPPNTRATGITINFDGDDTICLAEIRLSKPSDYWLRER